MCDKARMRQKMCSCESTRALALPNPSLLTAALYIAPLCSLTREVLSHMQAPAECQRVTATHEMLSTNCISRSSPTLASSAPYDWHALPAHANSAFYPIRSYRPDTRCELTTGQVSSPTRRSSCLCSNASCLDTMHLTMHAPTSHNTFWYNKTISCKRTT